MSDYYKCMNLMQDPCNMMGMTASLGDPSCAAGMNNSACTTGQYKVRGCRKHIHP